MWPGIIRGREWADFDHVGADNGPAKVRRGGSTAGRRAGGPGTARPPTSRVTLEKDEVPWLTCRGSKQRRGQRECTEAQSMGSVCNTCKWAAQVATQALQAKLARTSPS